MFFGMRIRTLIGRRDWREDLSAYMDGELSARDRIQVEAQLAESAEMREYLADLEEMRSALRALEPAPGATPFQLTTEMLNDPALVALRPTAATRALRLSMSTAAVGVATFAAVMVFDAVDSPTVTFTTTSAGDSGAGVPTAAVVTDEVEVERQSQSAAETAASPPPSEAAANAVQEEEAEETAAVAAVEVEEELQQAAQQANWQAQEESADEPGEQVSASSKEAAAGDPSRRAITAGRAGSDAGDSNAEQVTAADVVQQEETVTEEAEVEQAEASEPTAAEVREDDDSSQSAAADESTKAVGDDQAQASSQTQVERRTVATSVRHSESDWPLEQRPRSSTVELARDPSWEGPVQIVLAVVAIGATLLWLGLTIVDRRRRT